MTSQYTIDTNVDNMISLNTLRARLGDEKKACEAFLKTLSAAEKEVLEGLVAETEFEVCRYGLGTFLTKPSHPVFQSKPLNAWKATKYPKSVLLCEFATRTICH